MPASSPLHATAERAGSMGDKTRRPRHAGAKAPGAPGPPLKKAGRSAPGPKETKSDHSPAPVVASEREELRHKRLLVLAALLAAVAAPFIALILHFIPKAGDGPAPTSTSVVETMVGGNVYVEGGRGELPRQEPPRGETQAHVPPARPSTPPAGVVEALQGGGPTSQAGTDQVETTASPPPALAASTWDTVRLTVPMDGQFVAALVNDTVRRTTEVNGQMVKLYVQNPEYPYQVRIRYQDTSGDERSCQSWTVMGKRSLALSFPCRS